MERWIDLATASLIGKNAAECLGVMAIVGAVVGLFRLRTAARRDFILAWFVVMMGTVIVQVPVYLGGMTGWGVDLVFLSAVGRIVQNIGAILFVRAVLRDVCPAWAWKVFAAGALTLMVLL